MYKWSATSSSKQNYSLAQSCDSEKKRKVAGQKSSTKIIGTL